MRQAGLGLAAILVVFAGTGLGDSIVVKGTAYKDVYIRETGNRYYIQFPKDGSVMSVARSEVKPEAVSITPDEAVRKELLKTWNYNYTKLHPTRFAQPSARPPEELPQGIRERENTVDHGIPKLVLRGEAAKDPEREQMVNEHASAERAAAFEQEMKLREQAYRASLYSPVAPVVNAEPAGGDLEYYFDEGDSGFGMTSSVHRLWSVGPPVPPMGPYAPGFGPGPGPGPGVGPGPNPGGPGFGPVNGPGPSGPVGPVSKPGGGPGPSGPFNGPMGSGTLGPIKHPGGGPGMPAPRAGNMPQAPRSGPSGPPPQRRQRH